MKKMRKIMNNLNNKATKSQFSTCTRLCTDKGKAKYNILDELNEEKRAYKEDLGTIAKAVRAASKKSTGETPSLSEDESLSHVKDNYPTHFDSEEELEGASSELNRIMEAKRYIREEYRTNREAMSREMQKEAISGIAGSSKRKAEDNEESSTSKKIHQSPVEKSPVEKSPVEKSAAEKSAAEESPLSFVQELGDLYYDPFNDIGTD